jgi:hypothetical protein
LKIYSDAYVIVFQEEPFPQPPLRSNWRCGVFFEGRVNTETGEISN